MVFKATYFVINFDGVVKHAENTIYLRVWNPNTLKFSMECLKRYVF